MTRAKRGPLADLPCTVTVERQGARIEVPNVPLPHAGNALRALLDEMRALARDYPELVPGPDTIPAGHAIPVDTSDIEGRLGFR